MLCLDFHKNHSPITDTYVTESYGLKFNLKFGVQITYFWMCFNVFPQGIIQLIHSMRAHVCIASKLQKCVSQRAIC